VEVGLVRLTKPGGRRGADEFDGFYLGPDEIEAQGEGLIPYRRSRDIVQRYVEACRIFDEQVESATRLHRVLDGYFGKDLGMQVTLEGAPVSRNRFRKELQKAAWQHVFAEFLPSQMATTQLREDINLFVEKQSRIPFTERNLFRMLQIVAGTQDQRVDRAVEEVFDKLTKHTKENRWNVEGWATNSGYLFNRKFIMPWLVERNSSGYGVDMRWRGDKEDMDDLIKALCYVTGKPYEENAEPETGCYRIDPGVWHKWGFFEFKVYKKGTGHFRFVDPEDWRALNRHIAKIKGYALPEKL
jgi:hypothetical protein